MTRVVVLGGGPDAEREVSLASAEGVAGALREHGGFEVESVTVDRVTGDELASWDDAVVLPVLHGPYGEGGEIQRAMEAAGACFVGSGSRASQLAMDKLATKLAAARLGIATPSAAVVDRASDAPPFDLPLVAKPVHEGSSVGLYVCRHDQDWTEAIAAIRADESRVYMAEAFVSGRELTVGLIDRGIGLEALPLVEIAPASGVYDFEAKYERSDTVYTAEPVLPSGVAEACQDAALRLADSIGVRHVARVDFMLPASGGAGLLEINTMPGFTPTSLLPKAAQAAGIPMPALCAGLVRAALASGGATGNT